MEREEKKERRRKLNNKGFSLVELLIVIAIIAILAGVLSPQLIKYLDKSKKAADIQTAQTIATAVNAALADEGAHEAANSQTLSTALAAPSASATNFQTELQSILGTKATAPKFKPDTYKDFYIEVGSDKFINIYAVKSASGTITPDDKDLLYPTIGLNYK